MNNKQTNPALHPYTLPEGVVLEAKDIVTTFYSDGQRAEAVTGSGLTLKQGEIIGLVGESGSGKSVTSMSILQLIILRARLNPAKSTSRALRAIYWNTASKAARCAASAAAKSV